MTRLVGDDRLESEVKTERLIQAPHDLRGHCAELGPDALHRHGTDLFGLRFGIELQAGSACFELGDPTGTIRVWVKRDAVPDAYFHSLDVRPDWWGKGSRIGSTR